MSALSNLLFLLRPLQRRIMNLVARGLVLSSDDSKERQKIQASLLAGETRDDLERFQPYGLTSNPAAGAELVAIFVGGNRDHGLVLCVEDRRYRLKNLEAGEVALYDDLGSVVKLKRGGVIEISSAATIKLTAPSISVEGDLAVSGQVSDRAGTMQVMRDTFNLHTHVENGDGGGITDPPITPMT